MADFITSEELKQFVGYTKPGATDDDPWFGLWVTTACDEVTAARGSAVVPYPAWAKSAALLIGKSLWQQKLGKPQQQATAPEPRKLADALIRSNTIPPVGMA